MPKSSIHDVAQRAGVSIATVSRTFTQPQKVRPQTRQHVMEAASALNFTISRSASALKRGKSSRVAFLTGGEMESWYDSHLFSGINSVLHPAGYDISVFQVSNSQERHDFFTDMSIRRNADAVIIVSFQVSHDEAKKLRTTNIPIIGVNTTPMPEFSVTINIDETAGMKQVVDHLTSLGHHNLAYVSLDPDQETFRWNGADRLQGFLDACAHNNAVHHHEVIFAPNDINRADDAYSRITQLTTHPTAICCMNDEYAVPLLTKLLRTGARIPDKYSITGFDDSTYAQEIGLTTVRQNPYAIGRQAGKDVLNLISSEPIEPQLSTAPSYLVVRNTTAALH